MAHHRRTLFLFNSCRWFVNLDAMGRPRRTSVGGYLYHVLNQGNGRQPFFTRTLTTKRSFTWLPKRRNMCLECACWPIVCCQIHCGSAWSVVNPTEASGGSSTRPASLVWPARSGHEENQKRRRKKRPDTFSRTLYHCYQMDDPIFPQLQDTLDSSIPRY